MKTLALAGLMTLSAIAGSAITLSISQASFAQDGQAKDDHWTDQHPAGAALAQQEAAQQAQFAKNKIYSEYAIENGDSALELKVSVNNVMKDGWIPQGGVFISCGNWDCNYFQAVVR